MSAQNPSGTTPSSSSTPTSGNGAPATEKLSTPSHRRSGTIGTGVAIGIAIVLLIVGFGGGYLTAGYVTKTSSSVTQITETGSSLLYPLMKIWGPNYTSYNSHVTLAATSSGSGAGQSAAESGQYNIGGSDAYVVNFTQANIIDVPVAISAQLVYYNLPTVPSTDHLNLNGSTLAGIYDQSITSWTNTTILDAQNSTVQGDLLSLPTADQSIYLLKRSDSSGDTFLFTSLCYLSNASFPYAPSTTGLSGLSGARVLPESGNSGMVTGIDGQPGGIAYIGISYEKDVAAAGVAGVGYAAIGDNNSLSASGGVDAANYILPTATTISDDANLGLTNLNYATYGLAISLILGGVKDTIISTSDLGQGGTSPTTQYPTPYPLVNLEYTLIKTAPTGSVVTSGALAATVSFLQWAISLGNAAVYLNQVGFVPLTTEVLGYDMMELGTVTT